MLKVLKQRRKGFLSHLTKTINRAEISIEWNEWNKYKWNCLIKRKLKSVLFVNYKKI